MVNYSDEEKNQKPVRLEYNDSGVFLHYTTRAGTEWIAERFSDDNPYFKDDDGNAIITIINGIFHLKEANLINNDGENAFFEVGSFSEEIYTFYDVFNGDFELSVRKGSEIDLDLFTDVSKNSIMSLISDMINDKIVIGDNEGEISLQVLIACREKYPTKTELKHYTRSRIANIISEDILLEKNYDEKFRKYVQKRNSEKLISDTDLNSIQLESLTYISSKLNAMLSNPEKYVETKWQDEILKIILYLYPQYIAAFRESELPKVYGRGRTVDFILVDAQGYVDIIEIKTPEKIVITVKKDDRGNHIPSRIVSSTAIQIENYLFALNRWGELGESVLTKRYRDFLPVHIESVKISNPRGIMILGRSTEYNEEQIHSLELIKRHYSRITDLVTYDDLTSRLSRMIDSIRIRSRSNGENP